MKTGKTVATLDDLQIEDYFDQKKHIIKLKPPRRAVLDITTVCNQQCPFCYKWTAISSNAEHFPKEKIIEVARALYYSGISVVTLSGGEPFTHPRIDEIVAELASMGFKIGIVTNGCLINPAHINVLTRNAVDIEISVLGPNGYDDLLRGAPNRHKQVMSNIKLLHQNQLAIGIVSNLTRFCAIENNYLVKIVEEIYKQANADLRYFGLQRIVPNLRYKDYHNELFTVPKRSLNRILAQMDTIKNRYGIPRVYTVDALPFCAVDEKYHKYLSPCAYGIEMFAVSGNGKMRRCPCSEVSLGNIFEVRIESLWDSEELRDFRSLKWLPSACKDCDKLQHCLGGCSKSAIGGIGKDHYPDHYLSQGNT